MRSEKTARSVLLAIDTSTRLTGLALYTGSQVLYESVWRSEASGGHHTVELAPAVSDAFRKSGITATNLNAVAVATGPGSFTGLRIGLALAKGIAMAQNIPIIGILTLDALAASIGLGQPAGAHAMVALLRAGRGRLAACWYQQVEQDPEAIWQKVGDIEVLTLDGLHKRLDSHQNLTLVCGELTPDERVWLSENSKYVILASPALSLRRPAFLAELAWKRFKSGQRDDVKTLAPFYLHYNNPIPG
jgi:tRNA threonylcarbamoyladenosine biosynthesis protein TsaB